MRCYVAERAFNGIKCHKIWDARRCGRLCHWRNLSEKRNQKINSSSVELTLPLSDGRLYDGVVRDYESG